MGGLIWATEAAYKTYGNPITWQLLVDGSVYDAASYLATVTRVKLVFEDGTEIDSDDSPNVFDWSIGDGKISMKLGASDLAAGTHENVWLVTYDPANTSIVWSDQSRIIMYER